MKIENKFYSILFYSILYMQYYKTLLVNKTCVCFITQIGDPDQRDGFYVRYKQWYAPDAVCHGKWVNFICVLSARDLHKAVVSRHMFLNKLDLGMDPIGYQCLEQWLHKRTTAGVNPDFDLEFYKSRKLVNHHV